MKRMFFRITICLSAVVPLLGCGSSNGELQQLSANDSTVGAAVAVSHNDSLRFKMYYYEGVRQQVKDNYAAAYDLFRHCLEINPYAAEAYFMLSPYEGILHGDSTALVYIKKASELNPGNNAYLERLATGYLMTNDTDEAIKAYEKLADNNPERVDVLNVLVQLYGQKKDYDSMLDVLQRKEALEGDSEDLTLAKMRAYSLQGKKQEEFNALKTMSDRHPNDLNYRVMTGNWLLQNGKPDEAYAEYLKVLEVDSGNLMAKMSMIDYYRTSGQPMRADSLQEALLVDPKTPMDNKVSLMRQVVANSENAGGDSTEVLGIFRRMLSQPQETSDMAEMYVAYMTLKRMPQDSVSKALEGVLAISPDNSAARFQLLQIVWSEQDFDRVVKLSRQGLDYNPDEMAFYYFLGLAYIQEGDDDRALEVFRRGVSQISGQSSPALVSDFYSIMGDILHDKGYAEEAYAAYDSCLQWKDDNLGCLNNYAYYLSLEDRQLDKAAQMSYRTVQAEPGNSTYLDTYAWILFRQGKYADAQQYIDMAVENDTTGSAVIIEHAGDIHSMNGDIEGALRYWNEALEAGADDSKAIRRKIKEKKYVED